MTTKKIAKSTIECCGVDHTSAYCPACGTKLENPLKALVNYIDGRVKKSTLALQAAKTERSKAVNTITLRKWVAWQKGIKESVEV